MAVQEGYADLVALGDTATPIAHLDPDVAAKLSHACSEYRKLADEKGALEAAMKLLLPDIAAMGEKLGVDKVRGDGWLLLNVEGSRTDISPIKLIEKGVPIEVVNAATVKRTWKNWQVRGAK